MVASPMRASALSPAFKVFEVGLQPAFPIYRHSHLLLLEQALCVLALGIRVPLQHEPLPEPGADTCPSMICPPDAFLPPLRSPVCYSGASDPTASHFQAYPSCRTVWALSPGICPHSCSSHCLHTCNLMPPSFQCGWKETCCHKLTHLIHKGCHRHT